jgi:16S rRNA (guanine966-N2)-methyltransferase
LRGRRVPVPPRDVRPTAERARQAFFNIVGPGIDGARFLDLFAGSGIFSFEAVSRGASAATAVDREPGNVETIDRMAREWNVPVKAFAGEVTGVLRAMSRGAGSPAGSDRLRAGPTFETFDIVYADPPYDYAGYDELLQAIDRLSLSPDALVAIEHRRRSDPFGQYDGRLRAARRAEYGEVWITLFAA